MKKYPVTTLLALYDPDAIGIRTLATFVKESEGVTVNQIYFKNLFPDKFPYTEHEMEQLIGLIKDLKTEFLGISLRSSSYKTGVAVIERVRKALPEVKIIIGGTHAILAPDETMNLADMVCLGEGEYPFLELIRNYYAGGEKINNIPGLWVKDNDFIHKNKINKLIDIDTLPVIDFSDNNKWYIENDAITPGDPLTENSVGEIFSSRGCPYHCTYCTNNVLKSIMHEGKFVRLRSVDHVIDDIINLKKYYKNLKKIVFADEVFAFNKKWAEEFCGKYKSRIDLPFAALFHPDIVREDVVVMLKDAGLTHARMGIQSGSIAIRKELYKRNETNEKIKEVTDLFHKYDIRVTFDIIVNNPYETEDDLAESLRFLLDIPRPYELNMHSLVYFPKTELTEKAIKDGIIKKEHVEGPVDEALRLNLVLLKNKKMVFDYENNLFWNSIFSLTSKSFIPRGFILSLSENAYLRRNPERLLLIAKVANVVNLGRIGLKLFKDGEIGLKEILTAAKSLASTASVNK